ARPRRHHRQHHQPAPRHQVSQQDGIQTSQEPLNYDIERRFRRTSVRAGGLCGAQRPQARFQPPAERSHTIK
ncbi:MAG: hypothetical protein ACXVCO_17245, partial [Ktedonobacterales bacterium]